jgi:O-antigen/teichoic acid export membrane protein
LFVGTIMIAWQPSEWAAMLGVTVGAFVPVLVGVWALRGDREHGAVADDGQGRAIVGEIVHNSQALLAFLALSNADVIVARNVLSPHEAGLYAGGLILAKAVLFLPQFVVVIAFPSMSTAHARRHALIRSLTLVGLLGAACTAGSWLLPGLAMTFVGGAEYVAIESKLWLFAVLGTALSMLQLLVYSVLARRGQRSIYAVWIALALVVAAGLQLNSLDALLRLVVTIDVALLVLMFVTSLVILRRLDQQPNTQTAALRS